jgi:hypothetical protein
VQGDVAEHTASLGVDNLRAEEVAHLASCPISGQRFSGHLEAAKRALMFMLQPQMEQNTPTILIWPLLHASH